MNRLVSTFAMTAAILISGIRIPGVLASPLDDSVDIQTKTELAARSSQKKVDALSDKTAKLLEEYKMVLRETESLKAYNDQLEKLVESQEEEKGSLKEQIDQIELTSREVVPLMAEMLHTLETFVKLDVPFLLEERQQRLTTLKTDMDRADVSTSEKFRRILEAFQIENEYGRTIEAYQGDIEDEAGTKRTVDFLKIGRLALIYQTLDGKVAKAWDKKSKSWLEVDESYKKSIQSGLKIARKQAAPDLLTLPIPTAEVR